MLSEAFILLILAASWLDLPAPEREVQVLELFAGQARLTRLAKSVGLGVAAHDISFDKAADEKKGKKSAMDINTSAGLVLLDLWHIRFRSSLEDPQIRLEFMMKTDFCKAWSMFTILASGPG